MKEHSTDHKFLVQETRPTTENTQQTAVQSVDLGLMNLHRTDSNPFRIDREYLISS